MTATDVGGQRERLLYDSHTHTQFCGHAVGTLEAYAAQACACNLRGLVFTCHNPLPAPMQSSARMQQHRFPEYMQALRRVRQQWHGELDIRLGLECDYRHDIVEYLRHLIAKHSLDYVIGSIHPHLRIHEGRFDHDDFDAFAETYFRLMCEAAETGLFHAIGHFDLIKCIMPIYWTIDRAMPHIERCLDRLAETGVAIELNTSGYYRAHCEMHPGPEILAAMRARNIPVVLGSDAHEPERVGDLFYPALLYLQLAGYSYVSHYLDGRRQQVPINAALASVAPDLSISE